MDEHLKRRLVGATLIVALVVIFVPMLFKDKSEHPPGSEAESASLPQAIEERAIELPKSAADVAATEPVARKEVPESGYRIIPLDDAPPKPSKAEPVPVPQPGAEAPLEAPVDEDFPEEAGEAPTEKPIPKSLPPKAVAPASKPGKAVLPEKPAAGPVKKPKTAAETTRPASPATKPEGQAPKESERPPVAAEGEASPPKPKAAPAGTKPSEPPVRKPEPTKAAAPPPKMPPAKAPAATVPGKPLEPKRLATTQDAQTPSAWVVQAGTFTAESNARALAEKLRKQNLPAFVRASRGESATVYRVTVGPESNRARAEQIQKQIETTVGIRGLILPQR